MRKIIRLIKGLHSKSVIEKVARSGRLPKDSRKHFKNMRRAGLSIKGVK